MNKQWDGRAIPDDEPADKLIKVWQVTPHLGDADYDHYAERDWLGMVAYVKGSLESWLEMFDEQELGEGVTLTFKLVSMTVGEYRELVSE